MVGRERGLRREGESDSEDEWGSQESKKEGEMRTQDKRRREMCVRTHVFTFDKCYTE